MSGPKVVSIVTREETEALCIAQMRSVDLALRQLQRRAKELDQWGEEFSARLSLRRAELQRLFDTERWSDLQARAAGEVAFVHSEIARITDDAVRSRELSRQRGHRLAAAASSMADALATSGLEVPEALVHASTNAARMSDQDLAAVESELSAALRLLAGTGGNVPASAELRELASRLGTGEVAPSVGEWLALHNEVNPQLDPRVHRAMAEIEVMDPDAASRFDNLVRRIASEDSADQRALLSDSLVLDISAHLADVGAWRAARDKLEAARSTLSELDGTESGALLQRCKDALEHRSISEAESVIAATHELADSARRRATSQARRQAVLQGLAKLGYEVRENMATAWSVSGRIVVKKPGGTDYGVELGSVADAERMQVRLVGAADPVERRTPERDRDAETQWCAEVQELRANLQAAGSELVIERALAVGAQPVKTVTLPNLDGDLRQESVAPRRLTRDRP